MATGAGCQDPNVPQSSFYDERIGPSLEFGCVEQTAGCHLASDRGDATGNLDLSSFDALMQREDVLTPYGPYPVGLLLLKAGEPRDVQVETFGAGEDRFVPITTDIRHNAGSTVALEASTYNEIRRWIDEGYTRTGVAPGVLSESNGACRNGLPRNRYTFDPSNLPGDDAAFARFVDEVQPLLSQTCAGTNCHGVEQADLYLTCGDNDEELRWNYYASVMHLTSQVSTSELLRRPLSQQRGGVFHEGGDVFADSTDEVYQAIRAWAEDLVARVPAAVDPVDVDPGLQYFADRVQPVLVRKGCMFLNCHSPSMGHDLRFRGGAQGVFSRIATRHNYEIARLMTSFASPNPNDSRLVAKNLYPSGQVPGGEGILHRGGALFEDFGVAGGGLNPATVAQCAAIDADAGDLNEIPAYCVLARWLEIERTEMIASGELNATPIQAVVYVDRPTDVGDTRDFDTFRGNADLMRVDASIDAAGDLMLGTPTSLIAGCAGVAATADVRTPAASWDGERVAFAARNTASDPLRLYWMNSDGSACEPVPGVAPAAPQENGILTHDFDPAFAPDGRLVFASTRGNIARDQFPYQGPTRTPAAMQPNANLYVLEGSTVRQLTYLLNQEVGPSFMNDGRLILSAEKREPEFHMVAGRRQNLDGGDYHPLFAQRESLGFRAAHEIVEISDRNFAFVATDLDAVDGAGTIAIVNRSLGPDQNDRDPADRFYLSALSLPAPGAFGGSTGVFRSPSPLPNGRVLTSCDLAATSVTGGPFAWSLCELDTNTGAVRVIGGGGAGRAAVEGVAVYARHAHPVFVSRSDEPNGSTRIESGDTRAEVHIQDLGLLATLMFSNTREGRQIDSQVGGLTVLEAYPPPASATSFADVTANAVSDGFGQVFVDYRELGTTAIAPDGSIRFSLPGGAPILYRLNGSDGQPLAFSDDDPLFSGELVQREQMQFYPGERINQSFPRRLFNGLCGTCHGSVVGRELDVAVDVDILTAASQTIALDDALPPTFDR